MIEVLFVADRVKLPNGITMVMKNIIDHSDIMNVHFSIIALEDSQKEVLEYFRSKNVNIYIMPTLAVNNVGKFVRFFTSFFQENKFDIVHSHFSQIENIIFRIAKKSGVKKCVSHSHSSKLSESKFRELRNKIMCYGLMDISDYCIACSKPAGIALYGKRYTTSLKSLILKNGIDCSRFEYDSVTRKIIRERYNIADDVIVIGHIGRLSPVKNHLFMVDVLKVVIKTNPTTILMLVGDGEMRKVVEQYTDANDLSANVVFTGYQSESNTFLNAFDIFLMPSLHEGLGLAAIEAQANGLACVLSTTIPCDVNLTGVSFLDLNAPKELWASTILKKAMPHNANLNRMVKDAGYDIRDVCHNLFVFYKKILEC